MNLLKVCSRIYSGNAQFLTKHHKKIDLVYLFISNNGFKGQLGKSSFMELVSFFPWDFVPFFFLHLQVDFFN